MLRKTTLLSIAITTIFTATLFSQDYAKDTAAVRTILDSTSLTTTAVAQVTDSANGRITALRLGMKGMTSLPSEIGALTELQTLSLHVNSLTTLPSEIGNLTKLKELLLYTNSLTALPAAIGNLTNLEVLWVTGNSLTTFPTEIGNLTKLKRMLCNQNSLCSLPASIVNCKPTEYCDFSYNCLDANALSTEVKAWLDEHDAGWESTQTVPVIHTLQLPESPGLNVLVQNRDKTYIEYSLPCPGMIRLDVLDVKGRSVRTLVNSYKSVGAHSILWEGEKAGAGIYYIRLRNGNVMAVEQALQVR